MEALQQVRKSYVMADSLCELTYRGGPKPWAGQEALGQKYRTRPGRTAWRETCRWRSNGGAPAAAAAATVGNHKPRWTVGGEPLPVDLARAGERLKDANGRWGEMSE